MVPELKSDHLVFFCYATLNPSLCFWIILQTAQATWSNHLYHKQMGTFYGLTFIIQMMRQKNWQINFLFVCRNSSSDPNESALQNEQVFIRTPV